MPGLPSPDCHTGAIHSIQLVAIRTMAASRGFVTWFVPPGIWRARVIGHVAGAGLTVLRRCSSREPGDEAPRRGVPRPRTSSRSSSTIAVPYTSRRWMKRRGGVRRVRVRRGPPEHRDLWWKVLKNVRAGIMPPAGKPRPSADERAARWRTGSSTGRSGSTRQTPTPAASPSAGSTGSSTATRSAT